MKICIYGAASNEIDLSYIQQVEALGETLAKRGHQLIFGGGAHGLMGAAARGFQKGGGKITGVVPAFFLEEKTEALFEACDEMIWTKTMRERKSIMEETADAFIIAPGGVGTFDEFFQIVTLRQLNRIRKRIALYDLYGYYEPLQIMMQRAEREHFIRGGCLELYQCFGEEQTEQLIRYIEGNTGDPIRPVSQQKYG